MGKFLTIFTCTYNRAEFLKRLYKKLEEQTSQNFIWMIVDDGSTDSTKDVVEELQKNEKVEIVYIFKENGGLLTGYNKAIENLNTELAVCIDSDDYPPSNMVSLIEKKWLQLKNDPSCGGIVGLDQKENGEIIGKLFVKEKVNFLEYQTDKQMRRDRKIVVRSDLYKLAAPLKSYSFEKGISPHMLHMIISETHYFASLNEVLCVVDYQTDGMSSNIIKQYYESPHYFLDLREYTLVKEIAPLRRKIIDAIHYDSCCFLCKNLKEKFWIMPRKYFTWPMISAGYILSLVIRYKYQKMQGNKNK